ncbi:hypothetical protein QAD02_004057 [Eretmocerus hayati]|uniref:Uncharacterized protein n=1 Tax=Eretmocerus hayati TaxID=131215 RepID=A0ACC2NNX2_9HYME|nr:hypothetical protein QAD02_004057 [Eretmocerus hayati]
MSELPFTDVILILKPLCESFMSEPSVKKAADINELVNRTSPAILQKICENVIYPISYHLKNNTFGKDDNLKLIETIRTVILKTRVESQKLFYELYHILRLQLCQQNNSMELIEIHEELKELVTLCLRDLLKNTTISIIESFYTRQRAALISHGIYLCIKLARTEKSSSLRISAIDAVMALLQVHDEADSQDIVLRSQIADVVMLYLPGVISGLLEVALGSDIQNHKVTAVAIKAWSRALALVMQDLPQEDVALNNQVSTLMLENVRSKDSNDLKEMEKVLGDAKRTPEWYRAVSEKFKEIFIELDLLTKHSNFKVRKELGQAVSLLLLTCSRNMEPCFQIFIEILITLSEDENSQVSAEAIKTLNQLQELYHQNPKMKSIIEILEEQLYNLLIKLPRVIRSSGESSQLMWLNRFAGYLKILGNQRLSRILLSASHFQKLIVTLVHLAELDCSGVSLLEDITEIDFEDNFCHDSPIAWKEFKFLPDQNAGEKLMKIFKILGEIQDRKFLVESILKIIPNASKFKKELILLLNTILEVPRDDEIQVSICKQVVEYYLEPDIWVLPFTVSEDVSLQNAQNNIIQACLLLEGLGIVSNLLQKDFQIFLLKTLYPIMERAGCEHNLVRTIGLSTLRTISKSQNLDTIGNLFKVNVDYITYHVSMKLRRVDRNPGVLNVVKVVTQYTTMDFLPHLNSIVDDILVQSASNIQRRNATSFLRVFHAFAICIEKLSNNEYSDKTDEFLTAMKALTPAEIIINNIIEFKNAQNESRMYDSPAELEEFDENLLDCAKNDAIDAFTGELGQDEENKKPPYFVSMIREIMKRCLHYLPSQDFTESSLSMQTLKKGALILKQWENELLPVIHELWHPLVHRFQSPNPLVINHAWQLLCCIAKVSQDFIRARTLKQILPCLSSFLKRSLIESYKKDPASTYKYTQLFKLQREILTQMGSLVRDLKIHEKDTWDILEITEPYLDSMQHSQLQESCVNMYKEISDYNVDLVHIKCMDIWNRQVESVSLGNDSREWYSEVINCSTPSTFKRNLLNILDYIHSSHKEFL